LVENVEVFRHLTEAERTSISHRSIKLFTLSSIHQGTKSLLGKRGLDEVTTEESELAAKFWNAVSQYIPEWQLAASKKASPSELRREFVHAHGIALHSLGLMGAALTKQEPAHWMDKLKNLKCIDWSRKNVALWEGRALSSGRISKATTNVQLTSSLLKQTLGLSLTKEEQRLENGLKVTAK
jgi:DNA sulfur modification protein DndB